MLFCERIQIKILILAQTPPPFHGQSIMQKIIVDVEWNWCKKRFIKLDLSNEINSVGKFKIIKLFKYCSVLNKLIKERFQGRIELVYYPPASPNKIAFYRDLLLIPFLKMIGGRLIFHFHSGGFDLLQKKLNFLELKLAKIIYHKPALAITLLPSLNQEVEWIKPERIVSIPNGIVDVFDQKRRKNNKDEFTILFVGNLIETKGVLDLIKAIILLKDNKSINLKIIGGWRDNIFMKIVSKVVDDNRLNDKIEFLGIKENEDKWKIFYESDIFCLPTYETEAMPITLIESMMFELPIITTNWRAIPDIVTDGEEGFLIPINTPQAIAEKIELLVNDKNMREQMGKKGREKFLKEYTIEKHLSRMEQAFKDVLADT